jgi:hypothetical protein
MGIAPSQSDARYPYGHRFSSLNQYSFPVFFVLALQEKILLTYHQTQTFQNVP